MTKQAIWKNSVLAESNQELVVEGNYYFPPEDVNSQYLTDSKTTTICPWKGQANYFHLQTAEEIEKDIAWYYPDPKEKALKIKNYVAFADRVTIK